MTWLADCVLAALAVEAVVLAAWRLLPLGELCTLLLPGAALAVALRLAFMHAGLVPTGLALLGALVAHLADLRRRIARR